MRALVPLHRRIAVLVLSRTRGLGGVAGLMAVVFVLTIRNWRGGLASDDFVYWAMGVVVSCIVIPLVLSARPRELIGSEAALWLQKPVREVPLVLGRFGETLLATLGVSVLFGAASVLLGMAMGWDPARPPILALPVGTLAAFTIASMAFGAAAWLPRGSRAAVLGLIIMSFSLFSPEMAEPETSRGGLFFLARFVLFPAPDILRFGLGLTGDIPLRVQPVMITVAYALGWIVVGALGNWRATARGRIGYE